MSRRSSPVTLSQIAYLLEQESTVFQRHVLELVQDVLEDSALYRRTMSRHSRSAAASRVSGFLKSLPPAPGKGAGSEPVRELLSLVQELKSGSHASQDALLKLIAGELIHRQLWNETLERNPDTLPALRRQITGS